MHWRCNEFLISIRNRFFNILYRTLNAETHGIQHNSNTDFSSKTVANAALEVALNTGLLASSCFTTPQTCVDGLDAGSHFDHIEGNKCSSSIPMYWGGWNMVFALLTLKTANNLHNFVAVFASVYQPSLLVAVFRRNYLLYQTAQKYTKKNSGPLRVHFLSHRKYTKRHNVA